MSPLSKLSKTIRKSFPEAGCKLDAAPGPAGSSFLDVRLDDYWLNVEWRADRGFGVTARTDVVYGEGADEVYPELSAAARRVLWLLKHRGGLQTGAWLPPCRTESGRPFKRGTGSE